MIVLTIDNSTSNISGLDRVWFDKLRSYLSYIDSPQNSYYKKMYSKRVHLMDKKGNFPTGLLHWVDEFLGKYKIPKIEITRDLRKVPKSTRPFTLFPKFPLYEEQLDIYKAASKYHRGTISAVTGFGKSMAMAWLIFNMGVKTLVIVPNLTLKEQLLKTFSEIFGDMDNITIENVDSSRLNNLDGFDMLIIDEAHHAAASTYRKLNKKVWNSIYYRFCFTATPYRSKNEEQILFESVAGQVIYQIGYKTAVEKGYVVPVEAFYVEVPKSHVFGTKWGDVYHELVTNNEIRNQIISNLLKSLEISNFSAICLVKEIAHGEKLSKLSDIPFVSGQQEDRSSIEEHASGRIVSLIGTVGVLGEGVDTRAAEYVVIAGLGRSRPALMQQIGRGIRKYPGKETCKVIIIYDSSHKWTKSHFKEQCKVLKEEYGVIPLKLDVDV